MALFNTVITLDYGGKGRSSKVKMLLQKSRWEIMMTWIRVCTVEIVKCSIILSLKGKLMICNICKIWAWKESEKSKMTIKFFTMGCKRNLKKSPVLPTLPTPWDCSLPCSSIHGIFRQEYWSRFPFLLQRSSRPRDRTRVFLHCRQTRLSERQEVL